MSKVHKPYWFKRLPEIIHAAEAGQEPLIDRRCIERLFGVSRAEAARLMLRIGCARAGQANILTRGQLLHWLRKAKKTEGYEMESRRASRLDAHLRAVSADLKARNVVIRHPDPIPERLADLPANITLAPGRMVIEFHGTEDLLRALLEVSRVASNDYAAFQKACGD